MPSEAIRIRSPDPDGNLDPEPVGVFGPERVGMFHREAPNDSRSGET